MIYPFQQIGETSDESQAPNNCWSYWGWSPDGYRLFDVEGNRKRETKVQTKGDNSRSTTTDSVLVLGEYTTGKCSVRDVVFYWYFWKYHRQTQRKIKAMKSPTSCLQVRPLDLIGLLFPLKGAPVGNLFGVTINSIGCISWTMKGPKFIASTSLLLVSHSIDYCRMLVNFKSQLNFKCAFVMLLNVRSFASCRVPCMLCN